MRREFPPFLIGAQENMVNDSIHDNAQQHELGLVTGPDERCRKLAAIAEPVITEEGYRLVRIRINQSGRETHVQIMAERRDDQMMSVDDCSTISRMLSVSFDVEDPLEESYMLEVSSPGVERPLTRREDFHRFKGAQAKIILLHPLYGDTGDSGTGHSDAGAGRKKFTGMLNGIKDTETEDAVLMKTEDGLCSIPLNMIAEAYLRYQPITDNKN
jgi:ribosome maturation factor RimP